MTYQMPQDLKAGDPILYHPGSGRCRNPATGRIANVGFRTCDLHIIDGSGNTRTIMGARHVTDPKLKDDESIKSGCFELAESARVPQTIRGLNKQINELAEGLRKVKDHVAQEFAEISNRLAELDAEAGEIQGLDEKLAKVDDMATAAVKDIGTLFDRLTAIENAKGGSKSQGNNKSQGK